VSVLDHLGYFLINSMSAVEVFYMETWRLCSVIIGSIMVEFFRFFPSLCFQLSLV
jgi:hypothetical protein